MKTVDHAPVEDVYLTAISVKQVRNIKDLEINLPEAKRTHLILTGMNGCGKTSLLEAMRDYIDAFVAPQSAENVRGRRTPQDEEMRLSLRFNVPLDKLCANMPVFVYLPSKRILHIEEPKSIRKVTIHNKMSIRSDARISFLKHMVYLNDRLQSIKDEKAKTTIRQWFKNFQNVLRKICECDELLLKYDASKLTFRIEMPNAVQFSFNEMASGHASFVQILMELLLRLDDGNGKVKYDRPCVIFIDDIDFHLHLKLQKRILPVLHELFQNAQFIVTTQSPFVLTSERAVVFDLVKRTHFENLIFYPYDKIADAYFGTNDYVHKTTSLINQCQLLLAKQDRTKEQDLALCRLIVDLILIPPAAGELYSMCQPLIKHGKSSVMGID